MKARVRAVIIDNNKILLIKRTKNDSVYWVIPGGAVEKNEGLKEALSRESKEELGVEIEVKELFFKDRCGKPEAKGQGEYFYISNIIGGELGSGTGPEWQKNSNYEGSYEIEWRDIKDIINIDLKPKEVRDLIYCKYCNK